MDKKKKTLIMNEVIAVDETVLFERVSSIIENRKNRAGSFANREVTLMYWEVGQYIGSILLDGARAAYGKRIVATLSQQLVQRYGSGFERTKMTRMVKFAELFPDIEIVATLSQQNKKDEKTRNRTVL